MVLGHVWDVFIHLPVDCVQEFGLKLIDQGEFLSLQSSALEFMMDSLD